MTIMMTGRYSDEIGLTTCTSCIAGTQGNGGNQTCTLCQVGYYNNADGPYTHSLTRLLTYLLN
jgi:hypothetical protein